MLEVWLFATAFSSRLGLSAFSASQLCAAIERGAESPLLVELGMTLLRALCRQGASLRKTGQQLPPPMSADLQLELTLQQLPAAELVSPATWGEVLRSVGHLFLGFVSNPDEEASDTSAASAAEKESREQVRLIAIV